MKVIVCCKFSPDVQDARVTESGNIDMSRAVWKISDYDLQAIEAAVCLAKETGGEAWALNVGDSNVEKSALLKDLLSREVKGLYQIVDERLGDPDTDLLCAVLAQAVERIVADVVICGEGSADRYYRQTGSHLGQKLGWSTVNAVDAIRVGDGVLEVERVLEDEIEVLQIETPAVLSVTTSICEPTLPGMKAILGAKKKPRESWSLDDLGVDCPSDCGIVTLSVTEPETKERKNIVFDAPACEAVAALVSRMKKDGLL